MKSILLLTNNILVFEGLRTIMMKEKDLHICGWAHNIDELKEKYEICMPYFVLVDSANITHETYSYFLNLKKRGISSILILSNDEHKNYEWQDGSILMRDTGFEIVENIRYFSKNSIKENIEKIHFPEREKLVLRLLIEGETSDSIAKNLYISKHTVNKYLSNIYRKMNVKNKGQAISRALKMGML